MENRIVSLVIDATDAELLAQFWAEVLGWQVVDRGNYGVSIGVDGGPFEIDFRFVPDGPKLAKNRLHLDHPGHLAADPLGGDHHSIIPSWGV